MAAIDPQTLLAEVPCEACQGSSVAQQIRIALLIRTLQVYLPMAAVDVQSLLSYAKCYGCYSGSVADLIEFALLDQISQNASTGGGGGGYSGAVDPEGVQTAPANSLYRNSATNTLWWKASGSGNTGWVQVT